ncbi:MAG: nitrilase-related carbon-nitrogen hydrolase, partial [Verrucomicrobiota bacterium]
MNRLLVGVASVNQTPLDWEGNEARLSSIIAQARGEGVQVLCLPELAITGYGCEDAFLSPATSERAWGILLSLAQETEGIAVALGLPLHLRGSCFNVIALVADGEIRGLGAKQQLAGDGLHYEPRWFKSWPQEEVILHQGIPIGDTLFDLGGVRIGFEICEDAWSAQAPGARLAHQGMDLLLNPSASHFAFGKQELRRRIVLDHSRAYASGYLYANLMGNEAGRSIYDGGSMIAQAGDLLAEGPRLGYADATLTTAVIEVAKLRSFQARVHSRTPDLPDIPSSDHSWAPAPAEQAAPATIAAPWPKEVEFSRAVSLGLFDYVRKSHSRGLILSLSGGADSGSIACLIHQMARFALDELGQGRVERKLGFSLTETLTCVYQATKNSSSTTREAARAIAEATGAVFHEWDIDDLVAGYTTLAEKSMGRDLSWETDDIALQNIQARVRAPGVWFLANLKGALLIS